MRTKILITLSVLAHTAQYQAEAQVCTTPAQKSTIYFINGVLTTRAAAMLTLYFELEPRVRNVSSGVIQQSCLDFELAYNQTAYRPGASVGYITGIKDFLDSGVQRLGESVSNLWNYLGGLTVMPAALQQQVESIVSTAEVNVVQDLDKHVQLYLQELMTAQKIILVAHSQGNYYANESYRNLVNVQSIPPNRISIIAVATPSNVVGGNGPYITLLRDFIWTLSFNPIPLLPNTDNGPCGGPFECHSFNDSYLPGVVSGPAIMAGIISAIPRQARTGLVAQYSFDSPGQPGLDSSGNGNHGASVVGVAQVLGVRGLAARFTNGYIDLPVSTGFNLRGADFTLSVFVKSTGAGAPNRNWFTKASSSANLYGLNGDSTVGFSFDGGAGGGARSATDAFDGKWHHVAGVKRGQIAEVWIDGKLENTGPITSNTNDTGQFAIGRNGSCCEYFNGLMDEAKIWNRALSAAEIVKEATLGARYLFDENGGTLAIDATGNGNDGTINGSSYTTGYQGTALHFRAGTSDNVLVPPSVYNGWTNTAYFEARIKPATYAGSCGFNEILRKRSDLNDWELDLYSDGSIGTLLYDGAGTNIVVNVRTTPGRIPLNQWTKVATWYDGTTLRLLINDVVVASKAGTVNPGWNTAYKGTQIGNNTFDQNCTYAFDGDIDEVIIAPTKP